MENLYRVRSHTPIRLPSVLFIQRALIKYGIDKPVLFRLMGIHEVIPISIFGDGFQVLPGVFGQDAIQGIPDLEDFPGMDLDIRRLPLVTPSG